MKKWLFLLIFFTGALLQTAPWGMFPGKMAYGGEDACQATTTATLQNKPATNPVRMTVPLTKNEQSLIAGLKPGQVLQKTITIAPDESTAAKSCCGEGECCCTCQCNPAPCICSCTDQIVVR